MSQETDNPEYSMVSSLLSPTTHMHTHTHTHIHIQRTYWVTETSPHPVWTRKQVALLISCSALSAKMQDFFQSLLLGNTFLQSFPLFVVIWLFPRVYYQRDHLCPAQFVKGLTPAFLLDNFYLWSPWHDPRVANTSSENYLGTPY